MTSRSPEFNQELEQLKEELEGVNEKVAALQDSLQLKDDENEQLSEWIKLFFVICFCM